jgi:hypothetical protein
MKTCDHTYWLSLCTKGGETGLLQADRPQALIKQLADPDIQQPSLFVLIGTAEKSTALQAIFSLKRTRKFAFKRNRGEIHLHLDPSSAFSDRPILIAEGDITVRKIDLKATETKKCHETIFRPFQRPFDAERAAIDVYGHFLSPFTDVFCFFSADVGGYGQISCLLARWLETDIHTTTVLPSVIIVDETDSPHPQHERDAKENFLQLLRNETAQDPFQFILKIDVVAVLPKGKVSNVARYRPLKERLMESSDKTRQLRTDTLLLFSATHFSAFLGTSSSHFIKTAKSFDFVQASRVHNVVAPDLDEHISRFLEKVTPGTLTAFAAPYLASSFLLDNYPPETHSESKS